MEKKEEKKKKKVSSIDRTTTTATTIKEHKGIIEEMKEHLQMILKRMML